MWQLLIDHPKVQLVQVLYVHHRPGLSADYYSIHLGQCFWGPIYGPGRHGSVHRAKPDVQCVRHVV
jgi:hypothetical protein